MQPLVDGDILRYEIGFSGQYKDGDEEVIREWDFVEELLANKINSICEDVDATEAPIIYLTNDSTIFGIKARYARFRGKELKAPPPNFREEIAIQKGYKAQRKEKQKPFHFKNITSHLLAFYNVKVAKGLEADDLICMEQFSRLEDADTIICTRDKDLRMCPGWHYGWECGRQPALGPIWVEELGEIKLEENKYKMVGNGLKFFFGQVLVGDPTDNIPGLKGVGPNKAVKLLADCTSEGELYTTVRDLYKEYYREEYLKMLVEQINLLWMIRETDINNDPVLYDWKFWEYS